MDVSGRMTRLVFEAAEAAGIPRERLVDGLDVDPGRFASVRHRVPWPIFAAIVERLAALLDGDVERIRDVGGNAVNAPSYGARVVRDYQPIPLARASAARLGQVFLNVIVNALEAMTENSGRANELHVRTKVDATGRVVVELSDTGTGIPPEALGRIFDPFFTTKPVGKGTGLGLAICHQIVAELGGEIAVESTVGRGTTFRVVLLPAGTNDLAREKAPAPARRGRDRARVLVIDDEPHLLETVRFVLSMHDVAVAGSARAALDILARDESFDVVLCDLMMPEQTGMDLHAELEKVHPHLCERMVFMTGGAFTGRARDFLARVPNPCIDKPFSAQELIARIEHRSERHPQ